MSLNTFAIILQFDYERFHILSGWLPLLNAALSISVEVLFLLVKQGLSLYTGDVVLFKLLLCLCSLYITLLLQESNQLQLTLLFFLTFLLFSKLQLLVAYAPKFSELFFFLILVLLFFFKTFNLQCSWTINSLFHFKFTALLFFIQTICFILCFSNLFV